MAPNPTPRVSRSMWSYLLLSVRDFQVNVVLISKRRGDFCRALPSQFPASLPASHRAVPRAVHRGVLISPWDVHPAPPRGPLPSYPHLEVPYHLGPQPPPHPTRPTRSRIKQQKLQLLCLSLGGIGRGGLAGDIPCWGVLISPGDVYPAPLPSCPTLHPP